MSVQLRREFGEELYQALLNVHTYGITGGGGSNEY